MQLSQSIAIVTGGATGFGKAFGIAILQAGGYVFLTDINEAELAATTKELQKQFGKARVSSTQQDVTHRSSFDRVFKTARMYFEKPINMLVNNAGIAGGLEFPAGDLWEKVMDIDLIAVMRGTQVAVREFRQYLNKGEGVIVNIGSVAGIYAPSYMADYVAAKAGVIHFTRAMSSLHESDNIRVCGLAPAFAKTAMGQLAEDAGVAKSQGELIPLPTVTQAFADVTTDTSNAGRIMRVLPHKSDYFRFPGDKKPSAKL